MSEIRIPTTTGTLAANVFRPAKGVGRKPAALFIHGWQSAQDRMSASAEMLSREYGMMCLTVDLRGHGKTAGDLNTLSRKDFLDDVLTTYDFLAAQENVDTESIGVIGSSFGGYLAALLTAERKLNWIVLRVPADYPDEGFADASKIMTDNRPVFKWITTHVDWNTTAALRAVHAFSGNILIVESELDTVVPHDAVCNYTEAASHPARVEHVVMKDAPHSLTGYPEFQKKYSEILSQWIKGVLSNT